jgi:D-serine deaminase-like pyridoxal phosphate-dependent protein
MNGLLLPVIVENITTRKDNTVKLTLGTQELSPSKAGEAFNLLNKMATCYLSPKEISQRIRNVLWLLHQQENEGFSQFDAYYKFKTEQIIDHYKSKLQ